MTRLKLGFIGAGNIGKMHLMSIAALIEANLLDAEIYAIADIDKETLVETTELFDAKKSFMNYKDLIKDPNVDAVFILVPTKWHKEILELAIEKRKHVFCEKPLAHNYSVANEMRNIMNKSGLKGQVGLVLRFDPFLNYVRDYISEHNLGHPMVAHIRDDQHIPINWGNYSAWRGNKEIAGGGTLLEHSIHDVDLLMWLFGNIRSVYAQINYYTQKELDDHASLIMTHKNGMTTSIDSIWHKVDRPSNREIEVFFEKAYIKIILEEKKTLIIHEADGEPTAISYESASRRLLEKIGFEYDSLNSEQIDALINIGSERYAIQDYIYIKSILEDKVPYPGFDDAAKAHLVVDMAYKSSHEQKPILINRV